MVRATRETAGKVASKPPFWNMKTLPVHMARQAARPGL